MHPDVTTQEPAPNRHRYDVFFACLAPVTGFLMFLHTCWYGFVWDDPYTIVNNPNIRSWAIVPRMFFGPLTGKLFMYRPIAGTVSLAGYQLFHAHAWGYHLINILLHALSCALVYQLARRLCEGRPVAVFASLFFAVHAIHLEPVTWISAVAEPMVASAILAGLLSFLRYRREANQKWLGVTCLCLFVGLWIKETAVVLPLLVIAYEFSFGELKSRLKEFIYPDLTAMGFTLGVYLVLRRLAFAGFSAPTNAAHLPFSTMFFTWPSVLLFYLKHLVAPVSQSPFYDSYYATAADRSFWLPLLALLAAAALGLYWRKRSANPKLVTFCLISLFIPIIPVLNLRFFQYREIVHDRFLYTPSFFFCLLAGQLFFGEWNNSGAKDVPQRAQAAVRAAFLAISGAILLLSGTALLIQSRPWKDDFAFYSYGAKMAPGNARPAFWLATEHYKRGNLQEAERLLQRVVRIAPEQVPRDAWSTFYLLSVTQMRMGHPDSAETALRQAILSSPRHAGLHLELGRCLEIQGKTEEAGEEFSKEIALNSQYRNDALQKLSRLNSDKKRR